MEKEIQIDEMKRIQLDILDKIHSFCETQGIRYSLCGGTLLGAVRHKGYIPWDDDIDILMPRPDYESFLSQYVDSEGVLALQHYKNDITSPLRWARVFDTRTKLVSINNVSGIFVDIFPVDGIPSIEEAINYEKRLFLLASELARTTKYQSEAMHKSSLYLFVMYYIKKLVFKSRKKVLKEYDALLGACNFEIAEFAGAIVSRFGAKETLKSSIFKEYTELEFEGKKYHCMKDYDTYLRTLYGDYMQLPPKEKRITHHKFKVYWK